MILKLKFGVIRGVMRGVAIFECFFVQNKTPDCESDVLCEWLIIVLFKIYYFD